MRTKPLAVLAQNTFDYERKPLIKPTGFREYDARWLFGPELNLLGVQALGLGLGTLLHELGGKPELITGHDYRAYSQSIKQALICGLMMAGIKVHDIGLALSPMAYFAQFALNVPAVAMVTASHNDNGWTGVKMGAQSPFTFGPDEMTRLRDIVLGGAGIERPGGACHYVPDFAATYIADLTHRPKISRRLKVVVACGNGTAGAFAPEVLERIGCEIVPLDVEADYTFPRYNPNPEDLHMLDAMAEKVMASGADIGLGFDGDGDRCGVVDNCGQEIFADKVGVMLARDLAQLHPSARFVVDVKSTGLFATDPVLQQFNAHTDYWKTGHSYIKRRVGDLNALAGFEKSGHFFFNTPIGRGYDDGLLTALHICDMLDRNPQKSMSDLYNDLPKTWGSPTMSAICADEVKYQIVDRVRAEIQSAADGNKLFTGLHIASIVTVNGIRVTCTDGTWGLVRASSNKPEIVVVVESPVSQERMMDMFRHIDAILHKNPEVGQYNQNI